MTAPHETLWQFSLSFYAEPSVKTSCLNLQNSLRADVNILLYLLFSARKRQQFDRETIALIDSAVQPWRDTIIHPIRGVRQQLKKNGVILTREQQASFRQTMLQTELEAERIEQDLLAALSLEFNEAPTVSAAETNLCNYASYLNSPMNDDFYALLQAFKQQRPA